jgi:enterochelin esterase-like enzyme
VEAAAIRTRFAAAIVLLAVPLLVAKAQDDYKLGPESMEHDGVPKGELSKFEWKSEIFPKSIREVAVYVPAQYDPKVPACVMDFQDGKAYAGRQGGYRVPTVIDNLIHKKELPVIVAIFIDPGSEDLKGGKNGGPDQKNRSFEYDTLSDQYARFLEKEILPEVGKKYNLRQDAAGRAICGLSSGGICAFTAAWERPDLFSKVVSHYGSFTNIRGGDRYPGIIRKEKKKDLRVFLQDGSNDLDNQFGNWPLANQQTAAALKFKKYDYRFEYGDGGHNAKHGGSILPDTMRWVWRETK